MADLRLIRLKETEAETLGILLIEDTLLLCLSLELPWRDNQRNISCIPLGNYSCKKFHSGKFGSTYVLESVPNRSGILFHSGNTHLDTYGCILLGLGLGTFPGERPTGRETKGVTQSKAAKEAFLGFADGRERLSLCIEQLGACLV